MARARLGALRPLPRARHGRRPRCASRSARCRRRSSGLAVNVALLLALVPPLGIEGAGDRALRRLRGDAGGAAPADAAAVRRARSRRARIAGIVLVAGGMAVAGNLLLPTSGAAGLRRPARSSGSRSRRRSSRAAGRLTRGAPGGRRERARPARPALRAAGRRVVVRRRLAQALAALGVERRRRVQPVAPRVVARAAPSPPARAPRRSTPSASGRSPRTARCGACACSGRGCATARRSAARAPRRSRAARGGSRSRAGT